MQPNQRFRRPQLYTTLVEHEWDPRYEFQDGWDEWDPRVDWHGPDSFEVWPEDRRHPDILAIFRRNAYLRALAGLGVPFVAGWTWEVAKLTYRLEMHCTDCRAHWRSYEDLAHWAASRMAAVERDALKDLSRWRACTHITSALEDLDPTEVAALAELELLAS
jgi:hypothetical protein